MRLSACTHVCTVANKSTTLLKDNTYKAIQNKLALYRGHDVRMHTLARTLTPKIYNLKHCSLHCEYTRGLHNLFL